MDRRTRVQSTLRHDNNTYEASSLDLHDGAARTRRRRSTGLIKTNLWAEHQHQRRDARGRRSATSDPTANPNQITAGFLQASQRAVDPSLVDVRAETHRSSRPWHPFTKESQQAVTPNQPTEYEVEIYPTGVVVPAGDRLRLTVGTANTFTGTPTLPTLGQELGGTITLLHGGGHDSSVQLPVLP